MQQTNLPARPSLNRSLEGQRVVFIGGTSGFGMATAKAASALRAVLILPPAVSHYSPPGVVILPSFAPLS